MSTGYLVLESGQVFKGDWQGGASKAGEVVFNTSHSGYEEMATDPSYCRQILVTTAPMQGNYGETNEVWESENIWIHGFICLEIQGSERDRTWCNKLSNAGVPIVDAIDTRKLVLHLRDQGTVWGALVNANSEDEAKKISKELIEKEKQAPLDWAHEVSAKKVTTLPGNLDKGPRVGVIDFGCKKNILRELQKRTSEVVIFPSRSSVDDIRKENIDGVLLSNGPGDPKDVEVAVDTVKELLGWKPIFGICMGHQILALALGASTYKLRFGHRGSNHPMRDELLDQIYVTSQNHGYAVEQESLPSGVKVTHTNLNDNTVAGISFAEKKCWSVQFHPESHPGPHDAENLFDYFAKQMV